MCICHLWYLMNNNVLLIINMAVAVGAKFNWSDNCFDFAFTSSYYIQWQYPIYLPTNRFFLLAILMTNMTEIYCSASFSLNIIKTKQNIGNKSVVVFFAWFATNQRHTNVKQKKSSYTIFFCIKKSTYSKRSILILKCTSLALWNSVERNVFFSSSQNNNNNINNQKWLYRHGFPNETFGR